MELPSYSGISCKGLDLQTAKYRLYLRLKTLIIIVPQKNHICLDIFKLIQGQHKWLKPGLHQVLWIQSGSQS